jgi:hypothetical protein
MNVGPRVTRTHVAGKNYADYTFFNLNLVPDFEPRFVETARHGSMWWRLLHPPYCDARGLPPGRSAVG